MKLNLKTHCESLFKFDLWLSWIFASVNRISYVARMEMRSDEIFKCSISFPNTKLPAVSIWKWNRAMSNLIGKPPIRREIGWHRYVALPDFFFSNYKCKRNLTNQKLKAADTAFSAQRANCEIRRLDYRYLLMAINVTRERERKRGREKDEKRGKRAE